MLYAFIQQQSKEEDEESSICAVYAVGGLIKDDKDCLVSNMYVWFCFVYPDQWTIITTLLEFTDPDLPTHTILACDSQFSFKS